VNHKSPKSVHRLDRRSAASGPVGKSGAAGSGPAWSILEDLRPAGLVHNWQKRPPGRPRKDGQAAGSIRPPQPGPQPSQAPPASAPYVPIDVGILAGTLKGSFSFLSGVLAIALKVPAEELEVNDRQARDLAEAWKPLLDHYKVNLGIGALWANAIGTTFGVIGPKVQTVMSRRAINPPAMPAAEQTRIVPPGLN